MVDARCLRDGAALNSFSEISGEIDPFLRWQGVIRGKAGWIRILHV